ncbi:hypothetical protein CI238_06838, partial [Colletotrichum incanum]
SQESFAVGVHIVVGPGYRLGVAPSIPKPSEFLILVSVPTAGPSILEASIRKLRFSVLISLRIGLVSRGYVEVKKIVIFLSSNDGTLEHDSALMKWANLLSGA